MAENKNKKPELENIKFVESLETMKQYAKAVEDVLKLVDLTSNSTNSSFNT